MNSRQAGQRSFDWIKNPFTFTIHSDFFVGYEEEKSRILRSLENGEKMCLVLGPTGSGKTTFLKFIQRQTGQNIFLPKPPEKPEDWVEVFMPVLKGGLFSRNPKSTLYTLAADVNKKLGSRNLILFVDECHEASVECLEWLRTLTDNIENMRVVCAGLPVFETQLREKLETLMKRVSLTIRFTNLTKSETRELIKRRIEAAGGRDIEPFTSDAVQHIYDKTSGFPREVLRLCNDIYSRALEKNIGTVDMEFLGAAPAGGQEQRITIESLDQIPEKQREVLQILALKGAMTPSQIANSFQEGEYKSKGNAVRSLNNMLKRMMDDGFVERQKAGKGFKYKASGKFSTVFVNA